MHEINECTLSIYVINNDKYQLIYSHSKKDFRIKNLILLDENMIGKYMELSLAYRGNFLCLTFLL